jgi:hydroxypyruvate isomerase
MPRFAANLGYLFAERPLIERFADQVRNAYQGRAV